MQLQILQITTKAAAKTEAAGFKPHRGNIVKIRDLPEVQERIQQITTTEIPYNERENLCPGNSRRLPVSFQKASAPSDHIATNPSY